MTDFSNPYQDSLGPSVPEGTECFSGDALDAQQALASRDDVIVALSTVFDPEIPVNIYDLGLIYDITALEGGGRGDLLILMTLTAPACPVAGEMPQNVADAAASVTGVGRICVRLTWAPPWTPDMMSEDARYALGM